jgi:hypothetical protein
MMLDLGKDEAQRLILGAAYSYREYVKNPRVCGATPWPRLTRRYQYWSHIVSKFRPTELSNQFDSYIPHRRTNHAFTRCVSVA